MKKITIIAFAIILAFVIFTRFAYLTEKPFHHDESQYATFSLYTYNGSGYEYNPILHGPFLTYFNLISYKALGVSDFSARFGPALFGVLLVILLFRFSSFLGLGGMFFLAVAYAVSPSFTYFDRFLGMDSYMAFFSVLFIYFFLQHIKKRRARYIYLAAFALALLFLVKVNSYIYAFIFFSFLLIVKFTELPPDLERLKADYNRTLKGQFLHIVLGIFMFFAIFALFYTSFFSNLQGFFDGLFIKSLGYWSGQNAQQRIKGVFHYYFPIIMTYELPLLLITAIGCFAKIFENKRAIRISSSIILFAAAISIVAAFLWGKTLPGTGYTPAALLDDIFHIQHPVHLFLIILLLHMGTYLTYSYLREGRLLYSFVSFWLFFSMLIYSYAGEKVPWLTLNILMPMMFYCALLANEFMRMRFSPYFVYPVYLIILIALSFTVYIQINACIKNPADPKERLVFVQTSKEMSQVIEKIKRLAKETGQGNDLKMAIHGDAGWPLNWELRDYKHHFPPESLDDEDNVVIIIDETDVKKNKHLNHNYNYKRIKLREWWVPDMRKKITLKMLLDYYFKRKVWSETGSYDIAFFTRKDID